MICSLLNLDRFIIRLLVGADSTSKLEEEAGLRSGVKNARFFGQIPIRGSHGS
jgi:hypothetical protein